jgi:hypothetical protein
VITKKQTKKTEKILSFLFLFVSSVSADSVPLKEAERLALFDVWDGFKCTRTTHCPRNWSGVCPTLPPQEYSLGLECTNGSVTQLSLTDSAAGAAVAGDIVGRGAVVPTALALLTRLTLLYVFGQWSLTDVTVPSVIGTITSLKKLNFCCNRLGGSMPSEIASLRNAVEIDFKLNRLVGTIPAGLNSLPLLSSIRLFGNLLVGAAPSFPLAASDCLLTADSNESNCFSSCAQPVCCKSPRFCPLSSTPTTSRTTAAPTTTATSSTTTTTSKAATTIMATTTSATTPPPLTTATNAPVSTASQPAVTTRQRFGESSSPSTSILAVVSTIASTVLTSAAIGSTLPVATPSPTDLGVIIGAVVGSLALLALVGVLCCVIRRKARGDQDAVPEEPIEVPRSRPPSAPASPYNSVPRSGASEQYSDLTLGPIVSAYGSTTQSHSSYSPIPNQAPAQPAVYATGKLPPMSELPPISELY